jgi:hypothetical protein
LESELSYEHYLLELELSHGHIQTRQQAHHIFHINPVDSSAKKEVPLDADDDQFLNSGVEVAWEQVA